MPEQLMNSTLELVVNEQQLQNMSQIDLSSGGQQSAQPAGEERQRNDRFSNCIKQIKSWPEHIKKGFNEKMDDAKSKSDTKLELVYEIICAFASTTIWIICLLGTIIIPKILVGIGILNLDDCPYQPALPRLVFAMGFFMSASNLFNLAMAFDLPILRNHINLSSEAKDIVSSIINILFNCIVAFIYIFIIYYVYKMHPRDSENTIKATYEKTPNKSESTATTETKTINDPTDLYCDPTLYNFTYWFITFSLIFIVVFMIIGIISEVYNRYRKATITRSTPRAYETQNSC